MPHQDCRRLASSGSCTGNSTRSTSRARPLLTEFRPAITVGLSVLPAPRPPSPSVQNCWNSAETTISKGWSTAHRTAPAHADSDLSTLTTSAADAARFPRRPRRVVTPASGHVFPAPGNRSAVPAVRPTVARKSLRKSASRSRPAGSLCVRRLAWKVPTHQGAVMASILRKIRHFLNSPQ